MERTREVEQCLPDPIEEPGGDEQAAHDLKNSQDTDKSGASGKRHTRQLLQAGRANDSILVLGDAFPAKVAPALRTARHGFAAGVMKTTLESEVTHDRWTLQRRQRAHGGGRWTTITGMPGGWVEAPVEFLRRDLPLGLVD